MTCKISENRAKRADYMRKYRLRPEQLEKERARKSAWYQKNKEKVKAAVKHYRTSVRPDVDLDKSARRRAARKGVPYKAVSRLVVWERDNGVCHICDKPANPLSWHLEHVVPLSKGGEHSYENCKVSHPKCNWEKGNRHA